MMPFDATGAFGGYDDGVPVRSDTVLRRWWSFVENEAPWNAMPADDAFGSLRRILSELLNEAREIDHEERRVRLLAAARAHGAFRRGQLCGLADLVSEFEIVVVALRVVLCESGHGECMARDTVIVLDPEIRLSQLAAAQGWNRTPLTDDRRALGLDRFLTELE
jgi:hypothetical protein